MDCSRQHVLELQAGTTYSFMVTGCCYIGGPGGGELALSIREVLRPPNDDFDATNDTGVPFQVVQDTLLGRSPPMLSL